MVDISLAVLIGPYRNLTTLTSAGLALHPNIQVLNHAATRLWKEPGVDFIADPAPETLRRFVQAALDGSVDGRRGSFGGSILHAHAFDDEALRSIYAERFGEARLKADPRCLAWKDSMRVQNRLAAAPNAVTAIMERLPSVRFVLPVRDPLDCAASNHRTGHDRHLSVGGGQTLEDVLDAVLDALLWGLELRDRWPDRVFVFTEREPGEEIARRMAAFLDLPADQRWPADFGNAFQVRKTDYASEIAAKAREAIARRLARWPEIAGPFGA